MAQLSVEFCTDQEQYSDGDSEVELLELFSGADPESGVQQALRDPSWPIRYHLSPSRQNLLSWFPFSKDGSLLEVGAGCGALTGLFCKSLAQVTAVELTRRRAEILFARHQHSDNLEVIAGNIAKIKFKQRFDYVTCIGVLEYAGRFSSSETPYIDFLSELTGHLNPNGTLILAIENRLGLKYWAGAKEDHTGKLFDSIQGYPENPGVCTFSRQQLSEMLSRVGLAIQQFYYPLPDYKFPVEIFSDSHLPSTKHDVSRRLFPYQDLSNTREYMFNERLAHESVVESGCFPDFANSFLVFASRKD